MVRMMPISLLAFTLVAAQSTAQATAPSVQTTVATTFAQKAQRQESKPLPWLAVLEEDSPPAPDAPAPAPVDPVSPPENPPPEPVAPPPPAATTPEVTDTTPGALEPTVTDGDAKTPKDNDGDNNEKRKEKKKKKRAKEDDDQSGKLENDDKPDDDGPSGMNGLLVGGLQVGLGCLVTPLCAPIAAVAAVPVIGWILVPLVFWSLQGILMTAVGDALGQNRGAIVWPAIAGFLTNLVCAIPVGLLSTLTTFALLFVVFGSVLLSGEIENNPEVYVGIALGSIVLLAAAGLFVGALSLLAELTAMSAAALAYNWSADEKRPGDDEWRFPGFFSPNHAKGDYVLAPRHNDNLKNAMAY
jgi:hypothetical protein